MNSRSAQFAIISAIILAASCFLPAPAGAGNWSNTTISNMDIQLYVPDTPPVKSGKRALMLSLHGCLQKNTDFKTLGNWDATADTYGMVVALPLVPNGGKILGCWDYFDPNHTRTSRDDAALLDLVRQLTGNTSLNIDPNQVYITGLSSGGGETMVMGCLAPDVFAGIGIVEGPTIGTNSDQINPGGNPLNKALPTNLNQATNLCRKFAGNQQDKFSTQVTSVIYGSNDQTVDQRYNVLNAGVMASIYSAGKRTTFPINNLPGVNPSGTGDLWSDDKGPRVSLIKSDGMGHAWPAGSGMGPEEHYIAKRGVNYPAYVTSFFFDNNRRVNQAPSISASAEVNDRKVTIRGTATDSDDKVSDVAIGIKGPSGDVSPGPAHVTPDANGGFAWTSDPLPDNSFYQATVTATDQRGASTAAPPLTFDIGNPQHPPTIADLTVVVDQRCATVSGTAGYVDGDLERVEVRMDSGNPKQAVLSGAAWAIGDLCDLAVGQHKAVATALDSAGHSSVPAEKPFQVSPDYIVVTDVLTNHVSTQRVRVYPGTGFGAADASYMDLFQKYGASQAFPLYGYQGTWYADPNHIVTAAFGDFTMRARLAQELGNYLEHQKMSEGEAAAQFGIPERKANDLKAGKADLFSTSELFGILSKIGISPAKSTEASINP